MCAVASRTGYLRLRYLVRHSPVDSTIILPQRTELHQLEVNLCSTTVRCLIDGRREHALLLQNGEGEEDFLLAR